MQATTGTPLSDDPAAGAPAARARRRNRRLLAVWVGVAAAVVILDQLTKWWAQRALVEGVPKQVVGDILTLDLTFNTGAAFSIGTGYTLVLTLVALTVVVVCVRLSRRLGSVGWSVALGLLLGGALGNLTDRLLRSPGPLRGRVVDFVHLTHWPVFNVADASICTAAVLVAVLSLRGIRVDGTRDRPAPSPS